MEILDLVDNPLADTPYQKNKDEMITQGSAHRRSVKSSSFSNPKNSVTGHRHNFSRSYETWLNRLPIAAQTALATQKTATLNDLGKLANHIHEIAASMHVASTETASPRDDLTEYMDVFTHHVPALASNSSRDKGSQRLQQHCSHTSWLKLINGICRYHIKFGYHAIRYIARCTFSNHALQSRQDLALLPCLWCKFVLIYFSITIKSR